MIERLMFELEPGDMKIVSMVQFRGYILLATERNVYRLWHNIFDDNINWYKIAEVKK